MIMKIAELLLKYKSLLAYAFFGVCTTVVNVVVYFICAKVLMLSTIPSTVIAWIIAVSFAYVTNRKWVFNSEEKSAKGIIREIIYFFSCRFLTGVLDVIIMYVFVDVFSWNDVIIKIVSNILVIIINYIASKLLIFRQGE